MITLLQPLRSVVHSAIQQSHASNEGMYSLYWGFLLASLNGFPNNEILVQLKHYGCIGFLRLFSLYNGSFSRCDYLLVPDLRDDLPRVQCHLNNPVSFLSWLKFIFNDSLIFCQMVSEKNPIAYFCPCIDFQDFRWSLFIQTIMTCLPSLSELPHAVSSPVNGCPNPVLATWAAVLFPSTLIHLASYIRD